MDEVHWIHHQCQPVWKYNEFLKKGQAAEQRGHDGTHLHEMDITDG